MTRKDYIAIASAIKDAKPFHRVSMPEVTEAWEDVANSIADALKADNERFDRERFMSACGVKS